MSDVEFSQELLFPHRTLHVVRSGGDNPADRFPTLDVDFFSGHLDISSGFVHNARPLRDGEQMMLVESLAPDVVRGSPHRDVAVAGAKDAYAYKISLSLENEEVIHLGFRELPGIPLTSVEPAMAELLTWVQHETAFAQRDAAERREVFAANLMRMTREQGMRMSRLAEMTGISRQVISFWINRDSLPNSDNFDRLCLALNCTRATLFSIRRDKSRLLTTTEWARREGITKKRAEELVRFGLVTGVVPTSYGYMFPEDVTAPDDSPREVLIAKRRPWWVENFHQNFPRLVAGKSKSDLAKALDITPAAVAHWATKKGYPKADRLPQIAGLLGVDLEQLTNPPVQYQHD